MYKDEMPDLESVQVIPINLERLRLVKISNLSGTTSIVGGTSQEIRIRANSPHDWVSPPSVQIKDDGAEIEIAAMPENAFHFDFSGADSPEFDPDGPYQQSFPPFLDLGDEPHGDFPEDEVGREQYRRAREEYRQRRREFREAARRSKEQAREASRRARVNWNSFEFAPHMVSGIAQGIGAGVSGFVGAIGSMFEASDDLYVEMPAGVELEVNSLSGAVHIAEMSGFCRVKNTNGKTTLTRLTGGVKFSGLSGTVEANELSGRVTAKVTSGNVHVERCRLTGLDLSITSGNLWVQTALVGPDEGDYKINSTNGNVSLLLPKKTRASIDCRTLNGRIMVDPEMGPVGLKNRPGQSQSKIELLGGGRKVTVNTMNGTIQIAYENLSESDAIRRPSSPANRPVPPAPPPPTGKPPGPFAQMPTPEPEQQGQVSPGEEDASAQVRNGTARRAHQLEILQAIERGDLSVEEGLAGLNELGEGE